MGAAEAEVAAYGSDVICGRAAAGGSDIGTIERTALETASARGAAAGSVAAAGCAVAAPNSNSIPVGCEMKAAWGTAAVTAATAAMPFVSRFCTKARNDFAQQLQHCPLPR